MHDSCRRLPLELQYVARRVGTAPGVLRAQRIPDHRHAVVGRAAQRPDQSHRVLLAENRAAAAPARLHRGAPRHLRRLRPRGRGVPTALGQRAGGDDLLRLPAVPRACTLFRLPGPVMVAGGGGTVLHHLGGPDGGRSGGPQATAGLRLRHRRDGAEPRRSALSHLQRPPLQPRGLHPHLLLIRHSSRRPVRRVPARTPGHGRAPRAIGENGP